jgi:hypothetical protein
MNIRKHILIGLACLLTIFELAKTTQAASVYSITIHGSALVQVYNVDGDQIEWQLKSDDFPLEGLGAVDLALDGDSDTLFASYDGSREIELVNSKTMESIPDKSVTAPGEIAGMVFDRENNRLLAIHREHSNLYVFDYNRDTKTLTWIATHTLEVPGPLTLSGFGISLDEINDILYVSDSSNIVRYYDASSINFAYLGSIEIEEGGQGYEAVGIDVYNDDQGHKYLYSGA